MIDPTELRTGNLLTWNPRLTHPATTLPAMEIEVHSILGDKVEYVFPNVEHRVEPFEDDVVQMGSRVKAIDELEPIPIAPDVLERSGFKEDGKGWIHKEGSFALEGEIVVYDGQKRVERVQHLHQLQNAYFNLAGENLEIDHS